MFEEGGREMRADPKGDDGSMLEAGKHLKVTDEGREVSVALGAAPAGRLVFANGSANLTLRADAGLGEMAHARFTGSPPSVTLDAETLTFRYPRLSRPFEWRGRRADVTLTTTVPWDIDIRGGAATVEVDLVGIELLGFRIGGGASGVTIQLPPPVGTVPVSIGSGASNLTVRRPAEVPVRLQIRGGASQLVFDEQTLGAVGGRTQLQSEGFREVNDRYEITIGGGVSRLTVGVA
jgi:hypothetical protein